MVQNLRRGHYELAIDTERGRRLEASFTELALAICTTPCHLNNAAIARSLLARPQRNSAGSTAPPGGDFRAD
jgi:hypothetical protein